MPTLAIRGVVAMAMGSALFAGEPVGAQSPDSGQGQARPNPMRVVPNGGGREVIFTMVRAAEMSDEDFGNDVGMVERDLGTLKRVLEG